MRSTAANPIPPATSGSDPRWIREQQQSHAEADERLAHDLEAALHNRPGVLVERDSANGSRRR